MPAHALFHTGQCRFHAFRRCPSCAAGGELYANFSNNFPLCLVISDGVPSDADEALRVSSELKRSNVTIKGILVGDPLARPPYPHPSVRSIANSPNTCASQWSVSVI